MKGRMRKITGILLAFVLCIGTASQSGAVTIDEAEKKADQLESDKKKAEEEKKTLSGCGEDADKRTLQETGNMQMWSSFILMQIATKYPKCRISFLEIFHCIVSFRPFLSSSTVV